MPPYEMNNALAASQHHDKVVRGDQLGFLKSKGSPEDVCPPISTETGHLLVDYTATSTDHLSTSKQVHLQACLAAETQVRNATPMGLWWS